MQCIKYVQQMYPNENALGTFEIYPYCASDFILYQSITVIVCVGSLHSTLMPKVSAAARIGSIVRSFIISGAESIVRV